LRRGPGSHQCRCFTPRGSAFFDIAYERSQLIASAKAAAWALVAILAMLLVAAIAAPSVLVACCFSGNPLHQA